MVAGQMCVEDGSPEQGPGLLRDSLGGEIVWDKNFRSQQSTLGWTLEWFLASGAELGFSETKGARVAETTRLSEAT